MENNLGETLDNNKDISVVERKYTTVHRDADGNVVRSYEGICLCQAKIQPKGI